VLAALLDAREPNLPEKMHGLLDVAWRGTKLRSLALCGLAAYDDPKTPPAILAAYATFNAEEKSDALNTLASRSSYAKAILGAIAAKKIAAGEVSADIVRQLRNLNDKEVSARLTEVWGTVRESAADRKALMAEYKKMLTAPPKTPPDLAQGRAIFAKTCAQC